MKQLCVFASLLAIFVATACAQSSGSFTYGNTGGTHCVVSSSNGAITGGTTCASGVDCSGLGCTPIPGIGTGAACAVDGDCGSGLCVGGKCATGTCGGSIVAGIKTNSGSGNVFDIRPSAVIGLLTDVALQKNSAIDIGTSSAFAGVDFTLVVTPPAGAPTPCISPDFSVTYAARFIQISSNLFTLLGTLCTTTAPQPLGCFFSFSESTVSAHSFDWIVGFPDSNATANGNPGNCGTLASGIYGIAANWKASLGNVGLSEALTCVGPVNLTVQQNKIFQFNTVN